MDHIVFHERFVDTRDRQRRDKHMSIVHCFGDFSGYIYFVYIENGFDYQGGSVFTLEKYRTPDFITENWICISSNFSSARILNK